MMHGPTKIISVIPARYLSRRFPGKPLRLLKGKPVIQHVYETVRSTQLFDDVIVATDDTRIYKVVESFGKVRMTKKNHRCGTDRVAEIASEIDCDIVVNVQADEPFISKHSLQELILAFTDQGVKVASLMQKVSTKEQRSNSVFVVCALNKNAMYFSREPIPSFQNSDEIVQAVRFQHRGIYAFRKDALLQFAKLPAGRLEVSECLEQLRLLENGIPIRMVETPHLGFGIDTLSDLKEAQKIMNVFSADDLSIP